MATLIGTASVEDHNTGVSLTLPAGIPANSIGLLQVNWSTAATLDSISTGWTLIDAEIIGSTLQGALYQRPLNAVDSSSTVNINFSIGSNITADLIVYAGVQSALDGAAVFVGDNSSDVTATYPSYTPTNPDVLLLRFTAGQHPTAGTVMSAVDAQWTTRVDVYGTSAAPIQSSHIATRQITGGAGVLVTGDTDTWSFASRDGIWIIGLLSSTVVQPATVAAVAGVSAPSLTMTKLAATVAAIAAVGAPTIHTTAGSASATLVHGWTGTNSGTVFQVSRTTQALPATPTVGNLLLMAVVSSNTITVPPVGWTLADSSIGGLAVYLYYRVAGVAEPTSWTVTPDAPSTMALATAEYSGVTSTIDSVSALQSVDGNLDTGGAAQTQSDLAVALLAAFADSTTGVSAPTGGFTEQKDLGSNRAAGSNVRMSVSDLSGGTSGTAQATGVASGVNITAGASLVVNFKLSLNSAAPTPGTVIVTTVVPAPTVIVQTNTTPTPASVAAVATVPAPIVHVPSVTIAQPATVVAIAIVNSVTSSVIITTTVKPDVVVAIANVLNPPVVGDSVPVTTVRPSTVVAVASVPSATLDMGSAVTEVPDTVAAVAHVPTPGVTTGSSATATPVVVAAVAVVGSAVISSSSVARTAETVAAVAHINNVVIVISPTLYKLVSPTVQEKPVAWNSGLFIRMNMRQGVTLLRTGTSFEAVRYPTIEQQEAADIVYVGGHEYNLSIEEADTLRAAGYGDFLVVRDNTE